MWLVIYKKYFWIFERINKIFEIKKYTNSSIIHLFYFLTGICIIYFCILPVVVKKRFQR